jgi:D-alanine-D-alanine ligase
MRLAILFGGSSHEHEISIVSAIAMKKAFKRSDLIFCYLDGDRSLYKIDSSEMKSTYFSSGAYRKSQSVILRKDDLFVEGIFGAKPLACDAVLNLVHGRDGEDGKIASLLAFYGIAHISPRLEASVLSYNKLYTKLLATHLGIETLPYQYLESSSPRNLELAYPVMVKPVRLGSSIGVSVVEDADALDYALDVAFEFDDAVIIEPFISGIEEYNQAGCKSEAWELSIVEAPQKGAFLDFDKKYLEFSRDAKAQQADIDEALKKQIGSMFQKIYDPLFLGSIIRCDFFVHEGRVLLNEINPVPGSMANYLFEDFEGMVERLVRYLPSEQKIPIHYAYINEIQQAKGKV